MNPRSAGTNAALLALLLAGAAGAAGDAGELAPPPLRLPATSERRLENALRVVVSPRPGCGLVEMRVIVPAGTRAEPDSAPGLAAFGAGMLRLGTATRTAEQFNNDLDALAARFGVVSGRDVALASCAAPASSFEAALELLADATTAPRLDPEEFASARRRMAQYFGRHRGEPVTVADDQLWDAAFSPHPYAHAPNGDMQSLLALRIEDVAGFLRQHWRPDRATLVIAGDVTPERAFAAAQEDFGRWGGHAVAEPPRAAPAARPIVRVVDLPGASGSEIRVAARGPGRASSQLPAWRLAAASLESALRPAGVRVALTVMREASLLVLSCGAPADSTAARVETLRQAFRSFGASPPQGDSLAALQARLAQSAPLGVETITNWLNQWQAAADAGVSSATFEHEFIPGEPQRLGDAAAAARELLAAPALVVVAGPARVLAGPLARFGPVQVVAFEKSLIPPPDTLPAASAEQVRRGRAAVAAAILAHGGAAHFGALHALGVHGDLSLYNGAQEISGLLTVLRADPARLHYETETGRLTTRQVLDGAKGWSFTKADSAAVEDLDSTRVASLRFTREDDVIHLLRRASMSSSRPAVRGAGKIGLRTCDWVDFGGPDGQPVRIAIDAATHKVLAVETGLGPRGVWDTRRELKDFRPVAGLLLPYEEIRFTGGEMIARFRASQVVVNPVVDEALFRKPHVIRGIVVDR